MISSVTFTHPYRRALTPTGRYVMIGGPTGRFLRALILGPVLSRTGEREFGSSSLSVDRDDLAFVIGLLESGDIAPVIDRRYELREVPEASSYVEDGHAKRKVVITSEQLI